MQQAKICFNNLHKQNVQVWLYFTKTFMKYNILLTKQYKSINMPVMKAAYVIT